MRPTIFLSATLSLIALLTLLGCGVQSAREGAKTSADVPAAADLAEQKNVAGLSDGDVGAGAGEGVTSTPEGLNRKIIYNAQIELAVEDFAGVPDRVISLVKKFDAYVADSSLTGSTGDSRRGTWKIRVPVARFEEFVGAAKGLGEVIRVGTSSRDVSEEYYDVDARIRNKTKEEERLLKLLEERPGKLEDVIAIERELSRVREELERMQARLRVLIDLTSLTTVELSIIEIHNYQPPEAPTLATRVRRSFEGSLAALRSAGEGLLVAGVAIAPWLPVIVVGLCPAYFVIRRARRSRGGDRRNPTEG
ncbi:MAG: DUF4349 domain-containing protein [Pirellulales bacterium]